MSEPKQTCGNCKWAQWEFEDMHLSGHCDFPMAGLRAKLNQHLPASIAMGKIAIFRTFSDCPTWEEKR